MAERKLSIVFAGDPGPAKKAFGEVESSGGRLQGKLSSIASGLGSVFKAAAAGAAVAAAGVAAFVKGGVDSLINLEKITAQTNAVIKSTGGAAGVSADHIASFADSIEKATGIEAESIMQGQNLLLTFTNIKNGVGEGNDVFDQATSILADMSTALGTDASTSAVQLGKALNDPIKGVAALSKVGVSFTEQQKGLRPLRGPAPLRLAISPPAAQALLVSGPFGGRLRCGAHRWLAAGGTEGVSGPFGGRLRCGWEWTESGAAREWCLRPLRGPAPLRPGLAGRRHARLAVSGPFGGRLRCGPNPWAAAPATCEVSGPFGGRLRCGMSPGRSAEAGSMRSPAPSGAGSVAARGPA